eukprot:COSAG06_NODE_7740_length_2393_cov_4.681343_2_plen_110_part_00
MLHMVLFGCLTWMRRNEAPPPTHNLGPKGNPAVAVRLSPLPAWLALSLLPATILLAARCLPCPRTVSTSLTALRSFAAQGPPLEDAPVVPAQPAERQLENERPRLENQP